MAIRSRLSSLVRNIVRKERNEHELDEEVHGYVELLTAEKIKSGMSANEARRQAMIETGGTEQVKERVREVRAGAFFETLLQDVRYGLRQLRRSPGFTAIAVLTLALGIGANTAIFSVVNAVILRPLPYPASDRLVWITEEVPALKAELAGSADYLDWRDQNQTLDGITAYDESASFNMTGRGTPARVHAAQVSANFFPTLGVSPQLGRGFTSEEDRPNGPNAVILMHSFWEQYFGSDPAVLGKTVTLNATPYTVVGVMPASFRFPGEPEIQLLTPLALNEAQEALRQMMRLVHIIGRLKPDVTVARALTDLDAIRKRSEAAVQAAGPRSGTSPMPAPAPGPAPSGGHMMQFTTSESTPRPAGPAAIQPPAGAVRRQTSRAPGSTPAQDQFFGPPLGAAGASRAQNGPPPGGGPPAMHQPGPGGSQPAGRVAGPGPGNRPIWAGRPDVQLKVVPLGEHLAGNLRPAMLTLLAVVGLVLLIACANVANLMLTRASARSREVAVRSVLGAGRWRLVRQLLSESVILGLAGGVAGLLLAAWGVRVMTRLIPASIGGDILSVVPVKLDASVLLFTLAVSVLTGILFGLAPALSATGKDLSEGLKEGAPGSGAGSRRGWVRGILTVAELSLALVLLIGAGLLVRSFYRLLSVDPGFAPERVLTMNLSLTDSRYPTPQQRCAFFTDVLHRVEALPGVRSAALSDSLPLSPYRAILIIPREMASQAGAASNSILMFSRLSVSPSYFYTLGIPLSKGRTFTGVDDEHAPHVAVVNEALAKAMWPGENPLGRELPLLGEKITVVGVVANSRHEGLSSEVDSEVYVPYLQDVAPDMQLAVRTAGDPTSLASTVRAQIAAVDPEQPIYNLTTLDDTLAESVSPRRFNMLLVGIFAGLALALATVGIYGVMAFSVTQRTHEIGIRMALGAERREVLGLILRQGLRLTLAGVAMGVAGALGLTRFLSSFLYGVKPTDPATFIAVSLILTAVALVASYLPARRATKVDPVVALRYE
jgi:predicted permease